jgi:hypothetical protein
MKIIISLIKFTETSNFLKIKEQEDEFFDCHGSLVYC